MLSESKKEKGWRKGRGEETGEGGRRGEEQSGRAVVKPRWFHRRI